MYTFWVTYTHTHREMVDTCRYVFTLPWMWYVQHVWRFCQMFDPLFDKFKVEGNNYNHFNCKITVGKSCFCEIGACQNADAVFNPAGCLSCRMPTYFFQHGWHKTPFLLLCNYSPAYFTVYNYDNSLLWPRITSTGFLKTVHEKCPGASWSIGWRANQCSCFFRKSFDRKWLAQVYGYAYDDGMGLMRCSSATHYTVSWRLFHGQWQDLERSKRCYIWNHIIR